MDKKKKFEFKGSRKGEKFVARFVPLTTDMKQHSLNFKPIL